MSFVVRTMRDPSPAAQLCAALVADLGPGAHDAIEAILEKLSVVERAALAAHWAFWARPKQRPPHDEWDSFGFLAGRGFGKTISIAKLIVEEVMAGRIKQLGFCAQDESNSIAVQVDGPSGLIAMSPPWFKPEWEATPMRLVWPNGAWGYVRTPEVPEKIRGFDYDCFWACEVQSWPNATMHAAMMNAQIATRVGRARFLWDATAKRGHPLLLELLEAGEKDPHRHIVVRGSTEESSEHLARDYAEKIRGKLKDSRRAKEELEADMGGNDDNVLVKPADIAKARRPRPERIRRKALGLDPAVTARAGSDRTGIVLAGEDFDGQALVLGDWTGRYSPAEWTKLVLDLVVSERIDVVVVETNKGGDLVTQSLRAAAQARQLEVVVVGEKERPQYRAGVVYVRETYSRGSKLDRAEPLAVAYELGKVSHVHGVDLGKLETTLTTWEPAPNAKSPDDLDALVSAVGELLDLKAFRRDPKKGFEGLAAAAEALRTGAPPGQASRLLGGLLAGGRPRGI